MIYPNSQDELVLFAIDGNSVSCNVENELRRQLVLGLCEASVALHPTAMEEHIPKRFAIPALSGYERIAVNQLYGRIAHPFFYTNWIISPFTSDIGRSVQGYTKDDFVIAVMNTNEFNRVVDFVRHYHAADSCASVSEIRDCYKTLIEEYYDIAASDS